jgi:hypothetical protein
MEQERSTPPLQFEDVDWDGILDGAFILAQLNNDILVTKSGAKIVRKAMG